MPEEVNQDPTAESKDQPKSMVEIDGEQVSFDQIKEWKKGGMLEADYTRGKQQIAELEKQYGQYKAIDAALATNTKAAKKVKALFTQLEAEIEGKEISMDYDEVDGTEESKPSNDQKALLEKLDALSKRIEDRDKQSDLRAFNGELEVLLKEFPEVDRTYVLAMASVPANASKSLKDIVEERHKAQEDLKQKIIDDYVKGKKTDSESPGMGQGLAVSGTEDVSEAKPSSGPKDQKWSPTSVFAKITEAVQAAAKAAKNK